jgi:hypothetical protein
MPHLPAYEAVLREDGVSQRHRRLRPSLSNISLAILLTGDSTAGRTG